MTGLNREFQVPSWLRIVGTVALLSFLFIASYTAGMAVNEASQIKVTPNGIGSDTSSSDDEETPVTPPAEATLQSKFISGMDYYLLSECGVAVPRPNNNKYTGLTGFDTDRYWEVGTNPNHELNTSVFINYSGTPTDVATNPMKYANDYYAASYGAGCYDLPAGVTTLDQLFANKEAELIANDNGSGFTMSKVATSNKWGVSALQYKTSGGQYSEAYESYWVIKGNKYISISGLNGGSNAGLSADWRKAMDNMLFY